MASAVIQVISVVARQAFSSQFVPSVAIVVDCLTDAVSIEKRPFSASLAAVLPLGAKRVGLNIMSVWLVCKEARAVDDSKAVVAAGALSVGAPLSAVVADWHADVVRIEEVADRALGAGLTLPFRAAAVFGVGRSGLAASVGTYGISSVAELADSDIRVELLAVLIDEAADSLLVEEVSGRALGTASVGPVLAAEVVVDQFEEAGVVVFRTERGQRLGRVDLREVDSLGEADCEDH